MDDRIFDRLTRQISAATSRRGALLTILASVVAAVGSGQVRDAGAERRTLRDDGFAGGRDELGELGGSRRKRNGGGNGHHRHGHNRDNGSDKNKAESCAQIGQAQKPRRPCCSGLIVGNGGLCVELPPGTVPPPGEGNSGGNNGGDGGDGGRNNGGGGGNTGGGGNNGGGSPPPPDVGPPPPGSTCDIDCSRGLAFCCEGTGYCSCGGECCGSKECWVYTNDEGKKFEYCRFPDHEPCLLCDQDEGDCCKACDSETGVCEYDQSQQGRGSIRRRPF